MLVNTHYPQLQEISGVSDVSELIQRLNQNFSTLADAFEQQATREVEYVTINLFALLDLPGLNSTDQYGISDTRWTDWKSQVEADYAQYNLVCGGSASLQDYRDMVEYFYQNIYLRRLRDTFSTSDLGQDNGLSPFWLYDCLNSSTIRERKRLINAHLDYHPGRWGIYVRIQSPRMITSCFSLPILHIDPRKSSTCSIIFYLTSPNTIQIIESLASIRLDDSGLKLDLSGESTSIPATSSQNVLNISNSGLHYGEVSPAATENHIDNDMFLVKLDGRTDNLTDQSLIGEPCIFRIPSKTSSTYVFSLSSLCWVLGHRLGVTVNYNTGLSVESSSEKLRLLQLMLSAYSWLPLGGNTKPGLGLAINGSGESQHLIYADNSAFDGIISGRGELVEASLPDDVQGNWLPKETSQSESTSSISSMLLHIGSVANKSTLEYYNSNNPPIPGRVPLATDTGAGYDEGLSHLSGARFEIKNGNVVIDPALSPLMGQWIRGDSVTIGGKNILHQPWSEYPGLIIEGSLETPVLNIKGDIRLIDGTNSGISLWSRKGVFRTNKIIRKNDSGGLRILMEGGWSGTGPKMSKIDSSMTDDYGWAAPLMLTEVLSLSSFDSGNKEFISWFRPAVVKNTSTVKRGVNFARGSIDIESLENSYDVKLADSTNKWSNLRPDMNAFVLESNPLSPDPKAYLFFDWEDGKEQLSNAKIIGAIQYLGTAYSAYRLTSGDHTRDVYHGVTWYNRGKVSNDDETIQMYKDTMFAVNGGIEGGFIYDVFDIYDRGPYDPDTISSIPNDSIGRIGSISNIEKITYRENGLFGISLNNKNVPDDYILLKANCSVIKDNDTNPIIPVYMNITSNIFDNADANNIVQIKFTYHKGIMLSNSTNTYKKQYVSVARSDKDNNTSNYLGDDGIIAKIFKDNYTEAFGSNVNIYDSVYNLLNIGGLKIPYYYYDCIDYGHGSRNRIWQTLCTHNAQTVALSNPFHARYSQADVVYVKGKYVPPAYGTGKVFVYDNPDNVCSTVILSGIGGQHSNKVSSHIPVSLGDFNGIDHDFHVFFPNNKYKLQLYQDYIIYTTSGGATAGVDRFAFNTESLPTYKYNIRFSDVCKMGMLGGSDYSILSEVVPRVYSDGSDYDLSAKTSNASYAYTSKYNKDKVVLGELSTMPSYENLEVDKNLYTYFDGVINNNSITADGYNYIMNNDYYVLELTTKKQHNIASGYNDIVNITKKTVMRLYVSLKDYSGDESVAFTFPGSHANNAPEYNKNAPDPTFYIHTQNGINDIDVLLSNDAIKRSYQTYIKNNGADDKLSATTYSYKKESNIFDLGILPALRTIGDISGLVDDISWGRDIAEKLTSDMADNTICSYGGGSVQYPADFCAPASKADFKNRFPSDADDGTINSLWSSYLSCWYDFGYLWMYKFANYMALNHMVNKVLHHFCIVNGTEGYDKFDVTKMVDWVPGSLDGIINNLSTNGVRLASKVIISNTGTSWSLEKCQETDSVYNNPPFPSEAQDSAALARSRAAIIKRRVFKIEI